MLKHVILECGDAALIVNGHLVMTADPAFEKPSTVESVAEALAAALGQPLERIQLPAPTDEAWTWDGVLQALNAGSDAVDMAAVSQGGSDGQIAVAPSEAPPGGYFIMYNFEKTADHRATLSQARARGQELCDSDPLPATWSIHDENGDLVEEIKRSDGKSLGDLIKGFKPLR